MFLRSFRGHLLAQVKESTGITGLPVVPNARSVLIQLYRRTLAEVEAIPEHAYYRKTVEKFTRFRLQVCEEEEEVADIERRINCGQAEELIVQAKDELYLIPKMAEWKPWEVTEGQTIEYVEDNSPIPDHVPRHKNPVVVQPDLPDENEMVKVTTVSSPS